ncbi:MAG: hypothetical protein OEZ38_10505 [Gammaproteobacteria bacterium]|nr:hypothetical protein [Gammaproteobacteria bacterium]
MKRFRDYILKSPLLWLAYLLPVFVFMLSIQLHLHIHTGHQPVTTSQEHNHEIDLKQAHIGNIHDAEHASSDLHADADSFNIDISPEGINKNSSSLLPLFAFVLISIFALFTSRSIQTLLYQYTRQHSPYQSRVPALPPQLRAPPQ